MLLSAYAELNSILLTRRRLNLIERNRVARSNQRMSARHVPVLIAKLEELAKLFSHGIEFKSGQGKKWFRPQSYTSTGPCHSDGATSGSRCKEMWLWQRRPKTYLGWNVYLVSVRKEWSVWEVSVSLICQLAKSLISFGSGQEEVEEERTWKFSFKSDEREYQPEALDKFRDGSGALTCFGILN